jgi:hypothetical protein
MMAWAPGGDAGFVAVRPRLRDIRPPDPRPAYKRDGSRCDGVCVVMPMK